MTTEFVFGIKKTRQKKKNFEVAFLSLGGNGGGGRGGVEWSINFVINLRIGIRGSTGNQTEIE